MPEMLDIVNEYDEVIGVAERSEASLRGLGYRIIYVLFYTAAGEVIFQRRHPSKSFGGMLTTTVSGHVESGDTYDSTAVKETMEETGVHLSIDQLEFLDKRSYQAQRGMRWAAVYLHKFDGTIDELMIEENEGDGFVLVPIEELKRAAAEEHPDYALFMKSEFGRQLINEVAKRTTTDQRD